MWATTKYVHRPNSTSVKDIDSADILGHKYRYRQRRYRPTSTLQ